MKYFREYNVQKAVWRVDPVCTTNRIFHDWITHDGIHSAWWSQNFKLERPAWKLSYGEMQYAQIKPIIELRDRHFDRHLGICNPIYVSFYHWCSVSLRIIQWRKRSLYINKWLTYSQLQCFSAAILSAMLNFVIGFLSNFYNWCVLSLCTIQWKKRSLYINKWLSYGKLLCFTAAILFDILEFVIRYVQTLTDYVRCYCEQKKLKKKRLS